MWVSDFWLDLGALVDYQQVEDVYVVFAHSDVII